MLTARVVPSGAVSSPTELTIGVPKA